MPSRRQTREMAAVVVGLRDYGENHRIVDLLTAEEGKLGALARGARASKRRFAGALDLFVSLRCQLLAGGELWTLHAADILDARVGIRGDLERIQRASALVESAARLSPEHVAAPEMYSALTVGLDALAAGAVASAATAYPKVLAAAGILPPMTTCVRCGGRGPMQTIDGAAGGPLCTQCRPGAPLPADVVDVLSGGPCTRAPLADRVEHLVLGLVEHHLGKPLKSRASLRVGASGNPLKRSLP